MATCPKGHESATADYCDVCGTPMGGAARPVSVPPSTAAGPTGAEASAAGTPCPACGTPQTGRFCEVDGYDFLLAPPVENPAPPVVAPPRSPDPTSPVAPATSTTPIAAAALQVLVTADRSYFQAVQALDGEDTGALTFPSFVPERRFPLAGRQLLIGRRSRSRGVQPDIDLVGPPEDPGVSHTHALLVAESEGWAVVDLESANGTYLNDPASQPITPNTPIAVKDGDRIFLGAWTALLIQAVS